MSLMFGSRFIYSSFKMALNNFYVDDDSLLDATDKIWGRFLVEPQEESERFFLGS